MRNCGGQHQRRPGLSLMGLAACTVLIRSLSLKSTDWPLYLHEPSTCGTARFTPANIWPCGPSHTALVTLANQQPMQGGSRSKASTLFTYSSQPQPHGLLFFLHFSSFLFLFLSLNPHPFLFLPLSHHCLFGPPDPLLSSLHTLLLSRK